MKSLQFYDDSFLDPEAPFTMNKKVLIVEKLARKRYGFMTCTK